MKTKHAPSPLITVHRDKRIYTLMPDGSVYRKADGNTSLMGRATISGRLSVVEFNRMIGLST